MPRFFREGQVACRDKETQTVVKRPDGGDLQKMQLPLPNILDWLPLDEELSSSVTSIRFTLGGRVVRPKHSPRSMCSGPVPRMTKPILASVTAALISRTFRTALSIGSPRT